MKRILDILKLLGNIIILLFLYTYLGRDRVNRMLDSEINYLRKEIS